jgi:hypothetical protein
VTLEYSDKLHAYTRVTEDGTRILIPGVTTILNMVGGDKTNAISGWAVNMTVQWVLENWPEEDAKPYLASFYQQMRDKMPWDEFSAQADLSLSISGQALVKLLNDARSNHRKVKEKAADIGHIAHEWLEGYIKHLIAGGKYYDAALPRDTAVEEGVTHDMLDKATRCVLAALDWMEKHNFQPVQSERKIYSREYDYAGTLDWIAFIKPCGDPSCCPTALGSDVVRALGDFKSSNSLHNEYRIQTASYQSAWQEEFPDQPIHTRIVLRLGKEDGKFEPMVLPPSEFDRDMDGFLGTLQMYTWHKQLDLEDKHEKALAKAAAKAAKEAAAPPKARRPRKKIVIPQVQVEDDGIRIEA